MSSFSDGAVGAELQQEVQDVEELERGFLFSGVRGVMKSIGRGRLRGRLAEERRKRLDFVARLDLLHVVEVARIEELRAIDGEHELGLRADDFLHALGRPPFQPGPAMRKLPPPLPVARLPM